MKKLLNEKWREMQEAERNAVVTLANLAEARSMQEPNNSTDLPSEMKFGVQPPKEVSLIEGKQHNENHVLDKKGSSPDQKNKEYCNISEVPYFHSQDKGKMQDNNEAAGSSSELKIPMNNHSDISHSQVAALSDFSTDCGVKSDACNLLEMKQSISDAQNAKCSSKSSCTNAELEVLKDPSFAWYAKLLTEDDESFEDMPVSKQTNPSMIPSSTTFHNIDLNSQPEDDSHGKINQSKQTLMDNDVYVRPHIGLNSSETLLVHPPSNIYCSSQQGSERNYKGLANANENQAYHTGLYKSRASQVLTSLNCYRSPAETMPSSLNEGNQDRINEAALALVDLHAHSSMNNSSYNMVGSYANPSIGGTSLATSTHRYPDVQQKSVPLTESVGTVSNCYTDHPYMNQIGKLNKSLYGDKFNSFSVKNRCALQEGSTAEPASTKKVKDIKFKQVSPKPEKLRTNYISTTGASDYIGNDDPSLKNDLSIPKGAKQQARIVEEDPVVIKAAEILLSLSSDNLQNKYHFTTSQRKVTELPPANEQSDDSSDSFEEMTLKLEEMKSDRIPKFKRKFETKAGKKDPSTKLCKGESSRASENNIQPGMTSRSRNEVRKKIHSSSDNNDDKKFKVPKRIYRSKTDRDPKRK